MRQRGAATRAHRHSISVFDCCHTGGFVQPLYPGDGGAGEVRGHEHGSIHRPGTRPLVNLTEARLYNLTGKVGLPLLFGGRISLSACTVLVTLAMRVAQRRQCHAGVVASIRVMIPFIDFLFISFISHGIMGSLGVGFPMLVSTAGWHSTYTGDQHGALSFLMFRSGSARALAGRPRMAHYLHMHGPVIGGRSCGAPHRRAVRCAGQSEMRAHAIRHGSCTFARLLQG